MDKRIRLHLNFPSDESLHRLDTISESHVDPDIKLIAEVLLNISETLSTIAENFLPAAFPLDAENDLGLSDDGTARPPK